MRNFSQPSSFTLNFYKKYSPSKNDLMNDKSTSLQLPFIILGLFIIQLSFGQDKVYLNYGRVVEGKVTEVGPKQIKMTVTTRANGPIYIYNVKVIDSIVYADGTHEDLQGVTRK